MAATTISARSRTSLFVPRPMAFLQSGQAVTITSAPVASSCAETDRAICTCGCYEFHHSALLRQFSLQQNFHTC